MSYRNDYDAARARIEILERDLAERDRQHHELLVEIEELRTKEDLKTDFWLGYSEDQIKELEQQNRDLHQRVIQLEQRRPGTVAEVAHQANLTLMESDKALQQVVVARREVRTSQKLFLVALLFFFLSRVL